MHYTFLFFKEFKLKNECPMHDHQLTVAGNLRTMDYKEVANDANLQPKHLIFFRDGVLDNHVKEVHLFLVLLIFDDYI